MSKITPEQFELINGWTFEDQTTINLIRDGGFVVSGTDEKSIKRIELFEDGDINSLG